MSARLTKTVLVTLVVAGALLAGLSWWRAQPSVPPPDLSVLPAASRQKVEAAQRASREVTRSITASKLDKATAWGHLGEVYLAYTLPAAARDCLIVATRLNPTDFRWHYLYAEALSDLGATAQSAPAMANAYTAMRHDERATKEDRIAALCFLGSAAIRLNRPADARRTLEAALELDSSQPFALFSLGQLAGRESDWPAAIDYSRRALQRMPGRREILIPLADYYRRAGDTAEAAKTAQVLEIGAKAERLVWPDPIRASVTLLNESGALKARHALSLLRQGNWRSAAVQYAAAVAAEPNTGLYRRQYSRVLLALDMASEARDEVAKARQLEPENEEARELQNLILAMEPATANQALSAAAEWRKAKPESPIALQSLAEVQFRTAHFADALTTLQEIAARQPAEVEWRSSRARALSALGHYHDARQELATALRAKPDDGTLKLNYARILACSAAAEGRDGKLALQLSRDLMAQQKTAVRMEALAVALAETGQFEEPLKLLAEAIEITGTEGQTSMVRRLNAELRAFEGKQPYRERWLFEDKK